MDLLQSILWLTLNVYHEARSEDLYAQMAVVHTTLNRVERRNQSVKEVILAPYQFSWTITQKNWWPKNPHAFVECLNSVVLAIDGYDFTQGSTYYHRDDIRPYWAKHYTYTGSFGRHKFYKEDNE